MFVLGIVVAAVVIAAFVLAVVTHYRKAKSIERAMQRLNEAKTVVFKQRIEDQVDYD